MKQSQFDLGRVSAISDGVFAIAMTLLVLDLKLPDLGAGVSREAFAAAIVGQAPRFVSWLLSFAILARLWIMQHAMLATGDTRSRGFMGWTFVFLGAVSFVPFPTSLLSEHHDQALSVFIFSATLAVAGIALLAMLMIERRDHGTEGGKAAPKGSPRVLMYSILGAAVVSSLVALVTPVAGVWVWFGFLILAELVMRRIG